MPLGLGAAVASDIDFTRDSNSLRVEGDSMSRISCSIPCCSCFAKSSSVKDGGSRVAEDVDGGGGLGGPWVEVVLGSWGRSEAVLDGGTVEESKSSRMSTVSI